MPEQFTGRVQIQTNGEVPTILLNGNSAQIEVGGNGESGSVSVRTDAGAERVRVVERGVIIYDNSGQAVIQLNGIDGVIRIGTNGTRGEVYLENNQGIETIHLGAGDAKIELGANGESGDIYVKNNLGVETIHLGGNDARIELGANGQDGDIYVKNDQGMETIHLNGQEANLLIGGGGADGDIFLFPDDGDPTDNDTATIHLDGNSGDIILQNADAAEDFNIAESEAMEPGTVVVIGEDSKLHISRQSYDKRVAGVISGTGELRPGIILGRRASHHSRLPVALIGKVFCKVDATMEPIDVGDLLTTSPTPGHAMKASDPLRAFGTVIGKALESQPGSTGTIPILVALQ